MAFPAGHLNYRYRLQSSTVASTTDAGETVEAWSTDATLWGGRKSEGIQADSRDADTNIPQSAELVEMRYRGGVNTSKRLLRLRDATTLAAGINSSATTVTIAAALKFSGGLTDYIEIDNELMRVTAGQTGTTLTVERGTAGTTAASHSSAATVTRVEICHIVGVLRADEREDEMVAKVVRNV
jgi:head-tail adaptor